VKHGTNLRGLLLELLSCGTLAPSVKDLRYKNSYFGLQFHNFYMLPATWRHKFREFRIYSRSAFISLSHRMTYFQ